MTLAVLKPALYQPEPVPHPPSLHGTHCSACGHVFFPPQDLGCERCGAAGSALQPRRLAGNGTLMSRVTVHLHAKPERSAPFVVGTVHLDDGPVVRALLDVAPEVLPRIGSPMVAVLTPLAPSSGDTTTTLDLRFGPAQRLKVQE